MIKFTVVAEVQLDEEKYNEVKSWEVEPSDFVESVIADHARDRGLILKLTVAETPSSMYDTLNEKLEEQLNRIALDELQQELFAGAACINGNCED